MSVLRDIQRDVCVSAHMAINGETVTRITREGVSTTGIIALWTEYSEDRLSSQRPSRELDEGEEIERHGLLQVELSQAFDERDVWVIFGEKWVVQRVGANTAGVQEIYLQLNDKRKTSRPAKRREI